MKNTNSTTGLRSHGVNESAKWTHNLSTTSAHPLRRIAIFAAVLVMSMANVAQIDAATRRYYCKMTYSWWTADGAAIGAYAWKSSDGSQENASWPGVRMTGTGNTGEWYIDLDTKYDRVIFVRVNGSSTIADWGAKTGNLELGDDNYYTITQSSGAWDGATSSGSWSKYAPTPAISGTMNSWKPDANVFSGTSGSVTCSVSLSANTVYEFKVVSGTTWYGYGSHTGDLAYVGQSGTTTLSSDGQNIQLATAGAGSYVFTYNCTSHTLSVAYPEVTHPSSDYVYFKKPDGWSQVNAHVFTSDVSADYWPGPQPSTYTFDGTAYYYVALGGKTSVLFSDNGDGSKRTGDVTTASANKGKWYDLSSTSWKSFTATLELDDEDATTAVAPTSITVTYGASTNINTDVLTTTPEKTGYDFGGFYTETGGGGTQIIGTNEKIPSALAGYTSDGKWIKTGSSVSATLHAKWTAQTYDITYKDQGNVTFSGTQTSAPTSHTYGTATTLKIPTKSGYTFGGWYTASDCASGAVGTLTSASLGATDYTANITLYAKWYANDYSFSVTDTPAQDTKLAENEVVKTSTGGSMKYTPVGSDENARLWYIAGGTYLRMGNSNGSSTSSKVTVFLAKDMQVGSIITAKLHNPGTGVRGLKLVNSSGTTKATWTNTGDGETFTYVYTVVADDGLAGANSFAIQFVTTADIVTLTVANSGSAATSTITLDDEDATTAVDPSSVSATAGSSTIASITNPEKTGYTFGGWYSGDNGTDDLVISTGGALQANTCYTGASGIWAAGDVTLYAKWTANVYDITLDDNGGSADGSAVVRYDSIAVRPASISAPTYSGYAVTGYYTAATGGTKVLNADGSFAATNVAGYVTSGKWTKASDCTLYAHWGITPELDVLYRSKDNKSGWMDSNYPKLPSAAEVFECKWSSNMFAIQQYEIPNFATAKTLTLTLTLGATGANNAAAVWAFPYEMPLANSYDPTTSFFTNVEEVTGKTIHDTEGAFKNQLAVATCENVAKRTWTFTINAGAIKPYAYKEDGTTAVVQLLITSNAPNASSQTKYYSNKAETAMAYRPKLEIEYYEGSLSNPKAEFNYRTSNGASWTFVKDNAANTNFETNVSADIIAVEQFVIEDYSPANIYTVILSKHEDPTQTIAVWDFPRALPSSTDVTVSSWVNDVEDVTGVDLSEKSYSYSGQIQAVACSDNKWTFTIPGSAMTPISLDAENTAVVNLLFTSSSKATFKTNHTDNTTTKPTLTKTGRYVAMIGSTGYTSLSAAYTAATAGQTIVLYRNETLEDAMTIHKPITIQGIHKDTTLTRGTGLTGEAFLIIDTAVTIRNLTIASLEADKSTGSDAPILIQSATPKKFEAAFTNVTFSKFANPTTLHGIVHVGDSAKVIFTDVTFSSCTVKSGSGDIFVGETSQNIWANGTFDAPAGIYLDNNARLNNTAGTTTYPEPLPIHLYTDGSTRYKHNRAAVLTLNGESDLDNFSIATSGWYKRYTTPGGKKELTVMYGTHITFDANSGAAAGLAHVARDSAKVNVNLLTHVTAPSNYTRIGYFTAATGGTKIFEADGTFAASNITDYITSGKWSYTGTTLTLYPQWGQDITLDADGGSDGTESVQATYNSATLPSITNPTKTGYTFGGWYSGSGGTGDLVINTSGVLQASVSGYTGAGGIWTATEAKTLYAKWTAITYTITYKDEGNETFSGTQTSAPTSHTYGTATTLKIPTKSGYTFRGWYTASDCESGAVGNVYSASLAADGYTANITLYAKWLENCYSFTPSATSGDIAQGDEITTSTGGKMVATTRAGLSYSTNGVFFGNGSDEITVTLNNRMQAGSVVTLQMKGGSTSGERGFVLKTAAGSAVTDGSLTFEPTAEDQNNTLAYTVVADDGLEGTYAFRIVRTGGNMNLKGLTVSNCGDEVYAVTNTLTNVTKTSGDSKAGGEDYIAVYAPSSGYVLPTSITVTIGGATKTVDTDYTWDPTTGTLTIANSSITDEVGVTISGIAVNYSFVPFSTSGNLAVDDTPATSTGGTMTVVGVGGESTLKYNSSGLYFTNGGDSVKVTISGKNMQVGTLIYATIHENTGDKGFNLLDESGTEITSYPFRWNKETDGYATRTFLYVVAEDDGLEGTNVFKLQRHGNTYLKSIYVANCAGRYGVTHTLTNVTKTSGGAYAGGKDYTAVYSVGTGYSLPTTITVTIGGATKTVDTDYTWNSGTGAVTIPKANLTGAVVITVAGVANEYTITYKDQGDITYQGSNSGSLPATHTYDSETELVDGVRSGYEFLGWYENSACTGSPVTSIGATDKTANFTLYAKWGKTVSQNTFYQLYATSDVADADALITAAGFPEYITTTLDKKYWWGGLKKCSIDVPHDYSDINDGTYRAYLAFNSSTKTVTLRAVKNVKAVRFYGWNSGAGSNISTTATLASGSGSVPTFSNVAISGTDGLVAEHIVYISTTDGSSARTNYSDEAYYDLTFTFGGGSWLGMYVETNEEVTLTYNANSGSDAPDAEAWAPNETKHLSSTAPTRSGYIFKEWNTASDGSGDTYQPGDVYTMPLIDTTLYAQWVYPIGQNNFYQLYSASEVETAADLFEAAGCPSTYTTNISKIGNYGAYSSSLDVPHDFASMSGKKYFLMPQNNQVITLHDVANVKNVHFYGWDNADDHHITTTVTKKNGTGSVPSITTVDIVNENGVIRDYVVRISTSDGSSARANYSASDVYDLTFKFNGGSFIGMYVETNDVVTLTYNATDGTGAPSAESWAPNATDHLSNTEPTRAGYAFKEWNTAENGSGEAYHSGHAYTMPTSNTTLYAQWVEQIHQNDFYSFYSKDEKTISQLIEAAGFPSYISTTTSDAYWFGGLTTATLDVPHDFTDIVNGTYYSYFHIENDKTITIQAANVKAVHFYGWTGYSNQNIVTTVTRVNGTGSVPTISDVPVANVNNTVAHYVVNISTSDGSTARANYSASELYNLTFTFENSAWVGMYVETNDRLTLTYDANGGTGAPTAESWAPNATDHLSSTEPTRSGYDFAGWNEEEDGSGETTYDANGIYTMPLTNTTLYAKWTANEYTITYKDQGDADFSGTFATTAPTTHTYGTATTIKIPTRKDYEFVGWYSDSECTDANKICGPWNGNKLGATDYTADITMYAKWKANAKSELTVGSNPWIQTAEEGDFIVVTVNNRKAESYILLEDKDGNELSGTKQTFASNGTYYFMLSADNASEIHNGLIVSGSNYSTISAVSIRYRKTLWDTGVSATDNWEVATISPSLFSDLSTGDSLGITVSAINTVTEGAERHNYSIRKDVSGTKSDIFSGSVSATGTYIHVLTAEEVSDLKTYASGIRATYLDISAIHTYVTTRDYTVTLDNQGAKSGKEGTASISVTYDANTNLTGTPAITVPIRDGYTFGGYYTATGGGGTQIIAANGNVNASASDASYTYTDASKNWKYAGDITLYAKWTGVTYSITYYEKDGTTEIEDLTPSSFTCGAGDVILPTTPEKDGYTFYAWYKSSCVASNGFTDGCKRTKIDNGSYGDYSFYGVWHQTVTLDMQGVCTNLTPTVEYLGTEELLDYSTGSVTFRDDVLKGYYTAASGGTQVLNADGSFADDDIEDYITDGKWTKEGATTLYAQWDATITLPDMLDVSNYVAYGGGLTLVDDTLNYNTGDNKRQDGYAEWQANMVQAVYNVTIKGNYDGTARTWQLSLINKAGTVDSTCTFTKVWETGDKTESKQWDLSGIDAGEYTIRLMNLTEWGKGKVLYVAMDPITVTYDANGGTCGTASAVYKGSSLALPSATKSGYALMGWYDGETKIGNAGASYSPTASITLTAHWAPVLNFPSDTLNISNYVDYGGGLTIDADSLNYRTGSSSHVDGWTTWQVNIKQRVYNVTIKGSYNAGCQWELYLLDGSGNGVDTCTFDAVYKNTLRSESKRWTLTSLDEGEYTLKAKNIMKDGGPKLLYIAMDPITVTYDANGGTCATASAIYTGTALTLPTPTLSGYTFDGWYDGETKIGNAGGSYSPTASITLKAKWTANEYTITLDNQSATSAGTESISVTYDANTNLTGTPAITVPTRSGYTFGGYYTAIAGGGTQIIAATGDVVASASDASYTYTDASKNWKYVGDITLYAKWTAQSYAVTLDPDNGSDTESVSATYAAAMPSTLSDGETDLAVPEFEGYTFGGYYDDHAGAGTQYYDGTPASARAWDKASTATLYAKWTQTVTLNMQGIGSNQSPTVLYKGTALSGYTAPTNLRSGALLGFYTAASEGTKVLNADGTFAGTAVTDYISDSKWIKEGATTLYAQWAVVEGDTLRISNYVAYGGGLRFSGDTLDYSHGDNNHRDGYAEWKVDIEKYVYNVTISGRYPNGHNWKLYLVSGSDTLSTCDLGSKDNTGLGTETKTWNLSGLTSAGVYTIVAKNIRNWGEPRLLYVAMDPITVTYDANGGSCGTASAIYAGSALELPTPTRSGYLFTGWYSGDTKIGAAGASYVPTASITLTARWTTVVNVPATLNKSNYLDIGGGLIVDGDTLSYKAGKGLTGYTDWKVRVTKFPYTTTIAGYYRAGHQWEAYLIDGAGVTKSTLTFSKVYTTGDQTETKDWDLSSDLDTAGVYTLRVMNTLEDGDPKLLSLTFSQTNLALNKTAVAGYEDGNAAEVAGKVTDGTSAAWVTWSYQPAAKEYVYIDLGAFYQLNSIEVDWGADYSTDYILQACQNAPADSAYASKDYNWFTLAEVTDAAANSTKTTAVSGPARYVRLHSLSKSNDQCIRVKEIRVYGTGYATTYTTPTLTTAEVESYPAGYRTVQLHLEATDSKDVAIHTYRITDESGNISVVTTDEDDLVTISGLSHNVRHTLTVQAMDPGALLSESQDVAVLIWDPTANLALGKTVVAGFEDDNKDEVAAKVTDGNLSTKWIAYGVGTVEREWIYVDLGAYYQVSSIAVFWEPGRYMSQFEIQVAQQLPETASDDTQWFLVSTESHTYTNDELGNTEGKEKSYTVNASARYIRLRSKAHVDCASIYEFRVFGSGFATADENAPVITTATASYNNDGKAYLTLIATDEEDGSTNWFRIYNPKTETYSLQQTNGSDQIVITGLDDCTDYTFEVQAMDSAAQLSEVSEILVNVPVITGTNLALGKTATAGTTQGGFVAANAVDGNTGTMWSGHYEREDNVNQWLKVDLGKNYDIDSIKIKWGSNGGTWPQNYEIQVSYNGTDYWSIVHNTSKDANRANKYLDLGVKGRYVRVWANKSGVSYGMCITELEVYGQRYTEDNIYDFTGQVGSSTAWATAANWTKGVVPSTTDTVRLLAPVEIPVDNTIQVAKVIVATGGKIGSGNSLSVSGKLTVAAGGALVVKDSIKRCADAADFSTLVKTRPSDIVVKSSAAKGNGTLLFANTGDSATVELYCKASTEAIPWTWQYVGVPFTTADPQAAFWGGYMYYWPADASGWESVTKSTTLSAFTGYSLSHTQAGHIFTMEGELAATTSKDIAVPAGKDMVVGNSWTAPIQIKQLRDADFTNLLKNIYFYNVGNDSTGEAGAASSRYEAGTYVTVPIHTSPYTGDSVISALQGFFVTSNGSAGSLHLSYADHVRPVGGTSVINGQMHAPKRAEEQPVVLKIWASGSEYDDRVVLLEREDFSAGLDDGWDGDKWFGGQASPAIYAVREDATKDAVSALPELDGTIIGFRAGEDREYTLRFEYNGGMINGENGENDELYLLDTRTGESTLIVSGATYRFTADPNDTEAHERFLITRSNAPQTPTGVEPTSDSSLKGRAKKMLLEQKLYIYRNGVLYDAMGKRVERREWRDESGESRVESGESRVESGEKGGAQ